MSDKMVWVEQHPLSPRAVRIFKSKRAAFASKVFVSEMLYVIAVGDIRHQLWLRCQEKCELCSAPITEQSAHMHEKHHRGKGGEISLANSVFICPRCHGHQHRDRNPRFTKKS